MKALSDTDRGWVAGLFEGEGCTHTSVSNYRYKYPRLSMTQKDRSVLERLQEVTGLGAITGPHLHDNTYRWQLQAKAAVAEFVEEIAPLLSERRQQQIARVYEECGQ